MVVRPQHLQLVVEEEGTTQKRWMHQLTVATKPRSELKQPPHLHLAPLKEHQCQGKTPGCYQSLGQGCRAEQDRPSAAEVLAAAVAVLGLVSSIPVVAQKVEEAMRPLLHW